MGSLVGPLGLDQLDNDLVAFVYSDLSARASNPAGFARAVSWWEQTFSTVLARALVAHAFVLRIDQTLLDRLQHPEEGWPSGVGTVIDELERRRTVIPLREFLTSTRRFDPPASPDVATTPASWRWWLFSNLVARPARFAFSQLSLRGPNGDDGVDAERLWAIAARKADFVYLPAVDAAARRVLDAQRASTDRLWSREAFVRDLARDAAGTEARLSELDVQVLLRYLSRDLDELVADKESVKFRDHLSSDSLAITETDRGILRVKVTASRLQLQVAELEQQIADRNAKINELVRGKRLELAKSHLRSRKQLEELLSKRTATLESMQTVLLKLDTAAGDIQIMQAYESATSTLKGLLAHPSLKNTDQTLDALADALADQKEVEDVISSGTESMRTGETDDADLAAELAALEADVKAKESASAPKLPTLPDAETVPIASTPPVEQPREQVTAS